MTSYVLTSELATLGINVAAFSSVATPTQQAMLDAASAEADGYFQAQFMLPLLAWGADVKTHVANMAAYRLLRYRGFRPEGIDDVARDGYDQAIDWLKRVAAGSVTPPGIVDSTPTVRDGGPAIVTGMAGNTVGSQLPPGSATPGGIKPYPYNGAASGRRGW